MKKWNIVAMAAVLAIATATFGGSYAAEKLKIGFIYTGPIGDLGWSYQHDVGRKAMEKALAGKVETTYLENVPEGPDAERSIEHAKGGEQISERVLRTRHRIQAREEHGDLCRPLL
jgi:basic membrane protein A